MAKSKPEKLSVEQVLNLVYKLSASEQVELSRKLKLITNEQETLSEADSWLDADLVDEIEPYEWNASPVGVRVQYVQSLGFMVGEESA